jgi:putative endonuclease
VARFDLIAVYILANHKRGTLYVGATSDLPTRLGQHRTGEGSLFTGKYGLRRLVWFERHDTIVAARRRERRLKEWKRLWKIELIEVANPAWRDLSDQLL